MTSRRYTQTLEHHWADIGFNDLLEVKFKSGAGFRSAETNRKVERAAVSFVTSWYESLGWRVKSVEAEKCGYDLRCLKDFAEEHVEVKGAQGELPTFIITAAEVRRAQDDSSFVICVVTSALKKPKLYQYSGKELIENFKLSPLAYRAILYT